MNLTQDLFYTAGGSLRHDAPCYVKRPADSELLQSVLRGEYCYVLTSRQMGKSSLMVRTSAQLRERGVAVVALDLTAVGQNLSPEQWYDGLLAVVGRQLRLEDRLDSFWLDHQRFSPVQRFFSALREVVLGGLENQVAIFIDEVDTVRSLPFSTDEFFAAIRECYNRRTDDDAFRRLAFCLLGVATPFELMRDSAKTPFSIGRRIELTDLDENEAHLLAQPLATNSNISGEWLKHVLRWTSGHPYLTQRIFQSIADEKCTFENTDCATIQAVVDKVCERLFLSPRARERDDNLLFVRERLLHAESSLSKLLGLYERVLKQERVADVDGDDRIAQLRMAGLVRVIDGHLQVRNRIYGEVFNLDWIRTQMPDGELERDDGQRLRIDGTCNLGRGSTNDFVLNDQKVSRRHALIQAQKQHEFWLLDLGSSNGTYVNGKRVTQPALLHDGDQIEIGPFRFTFHQSKNPIWSDENNTQSNQTVLLKKTLHQ